MVYTEPKVFEERGGRGRGREWYGRMRTQGTGAARYSAEQERMSVSPRTDIVEQKHEEYW